MHMVGLAWIILFLSKKAQVDQFEQLIIEYVAMPALTSSSCTFYDSSKVPDAFLNPCLCAVLEMFHFAAA